MPLYDYECGHCHGRFSMLRSVAERHAHAECTVCGKGQLRMQISAPRTLMSRPGAFRASSPQQQLAGPAAAGPGTKTRARTSVLHQCVGPSCSVCG